MSPKTLIKSEELTARLHAMIPHDRVGDMLFMDDPEEWS